MQFKPLCLAVDLDATVCDLHSEWLALYNAEFEEGTTLHDLKSYSMESNVKIGKAIYKYLDDAHLYRRLEPLPGAIDALRRLSLSGHDVQIVSAHSKDEQTAADKLWWCKQFLPFIHWRSVNLSHQKHRFNADVFVDDSPDNIEIHAKWQPDSYRVAIAFPYNECVKSLLDLRAESYADPRAAWEEIEDFVNRVARGEISRAT